MPPEKTDGKSSVPMDRRTYTNTNISRKGRISYD